MTQVEILKHDGIVSLPPNPIMFQPEYTDCIGALQFNLYIDMFGIY